MKLLSLLAVFFFATVDGSTILIQISFGAMSHKLAMIPLVEELAARGHRVIFLTPHAAKERTPYEDVAPKEIVQWNTEVFKDTDVVRDRLESGISWLIVKMPLFMLDSCEALLSTELYDKFIKREIKLDMVIVDPAAAECAVGLAQHLDIPFGYYCTTGMYPWIAAPLGMPTMAMYKPGMLNPGFTDVSRFVDRLAFFLDDFYWSVARTYYLFPGIQKLWEKRLGHPVTNMVEYERNLSLVLTNAQLITELPAVFTPNVIDIGGSHLPKKVKPLPAEIKAFADKGDFILFSLGSAVSIRRLPDYLFNSFVETMRKLKENVMWKIDVEEDELKGKLPPNVRAFKWLPQFDILAHPNCKAFVSHGGKLSTTETLFHGIPVVVIPFFTDQDGHGALAERKGYGLSQELRFVTDTTLYEKIRKVLDDPSFRQRASELSPILKDNPQPPVEKGAYWIEYVIRHKGAPHLRPYARHLTWWQFHLVDVWLVILVALLLLLTVPVLIIRIVLNYLCRGKTKTD